MKVYTGELDGLALAMRGNRLCGACVHWDRENAQPITGYGVDVGEAARCNLGMGVKRSDSVCEHFSAVEGWPPTPPSEE